MCRFQTRFMHDCIIYAVSWYFPLIFLYTSCCRMELEIDYSTVVCSRTSCFDTHLCCVNQVALILTRWNYKTKAGRSVSKQCHFQSHCHPKARSSSNETTVKWSIIVTLAFILGFSVNFQVFRRRRAMQRLTRRLHLRFLRYKIFRFRQAQQFIAFVTVVIKFCGNVLPNILLSTHSW